MAPDRSVPSSRFRSQKSRQRSRKLYSYEPVDKSAKEIRLLTLLPGSTSSKVQIRLHHAILGTDPPPIYEALSYAWGSTENPVNVEVLCNGRKTLSITQNLAEALPYLRYDDKPRTLWIDAICIDQSNVIERGHQVGFMRDIFKSAHRVIIWLGPERDNSTHALEILDHLGSMVEVDKDAQKLRTSSHGRTEPEWADVDTPLPYQRRDWLALNFLILRPYFGRLFVLQEVLADPGAVILCGTSSLEWQRFYPALCGIAWTVYNASDLGPGRVQSFRARVRLITMGFRQRIHLIETLLRGTCEFLCADPRDKVYAALGLLHESETQFVLEPDYRKTVAQVYQDVVLQDLRAHQRLDVLTCCELQESPSRTSGSFEPMPSWVPDWTNTKRTRQLVFNRATARYSAVANYKADGVLESAGIYVATIESTESIDDPMSERGVLRWIRRVMRGVVVDEPYAKGGSSLDAYCRTFCTNAFAENSEPPSSEYGEWQTSKDSLVRLLQDNEATDEATLLTVLERVYLGWIRVYGERRSFVTTSEGHIGLAPKAVKPGDIVCVLLGCASPLTLRRIDNNQYKVVGETYLCGIMDGEALLGPLPQEYRPTKCYDEGSKLWVFRYRNMQTGCMEVVDPRLRRLTPGHTVKYKKLGGKHSSKLFTSAGLAECGVNVVNFELV